MNKSQLMEQLEKEILDADLIIDKADPKLVLGKGSVNAKILIIGEAPGAKEAQMGIPFVGAAGRELDKLLRGIGLTLEEVYIANILKYRPPNNRDPLPEEIKTHTPYLVKQIQIIQPEVIITLGNFSTKFILAGCNLEKMKEIEGISQLHGSFHKIIFEKKAYTVMPSYHPAAMLYKPPLRAAIQTDFEQMGERLDLKPKTLFDY